MASLSRLTERVGLTTLDLSGQPLDRVVEGLLAWAPHGRGSPSVVIVEGGQAVGRLLWMGKQQHAPADIPSRNSLQLEWNKFSMVPESSTGVRPNSPRYPMQSLKVDRRSFSEGDTTGLFIRPEQPGWHRLRGR